MSKEFSVEQLQALMKSVAENHLGELSLEYEGFRLKIKGASAVPAPVPAPTEIAAIAPAVACAVPAADTARYLTSPIVGTFYASSAPDKEPLAAVGKQLAVGDTAFIVESMKVMNEVPAELAGVVREVLVENGASVEFGQPILRLE